MISRDTRQSRREYTDSRKEAHKTFRRKKREFYKIKLDNIQSAYNNKAVKTFYKEVNSMKKGFKPQSDFVKDKMENIISNKAQVLDRWSEFYYEHFKSDVHIGEINM